MTAPLGMSRERLIEVTGATPEQVDALVARFHETYPVLREWNAHFARVLKERREMIQCDVILDPGEVNVWLVEKGHDPVHDFADKEKATAIIERSQVKAALLGENADGVAVVLLAVPSTPADVAEGRPTVIPASLALLENICEAMRAQVGPDSRLTDEPG